MMKIEKGWECGKCGAVMSPFAMVCINCKGNNEVCSGNAVRKATGVIHKRITNPSSGVEICQKTCPDYKNGTCSSNGGAVTTKGDDCMWGR